LKPFSPSFNVSIKPLIVEIVSCAWTTVLLFRSPHVRQLLENFRKVQIENGASDQQMVEWLKRNGEKKTADEIKPWGDEVTATNYSDNPEKREWFVEQLKPLGLDPTTTTLFDWLETDDRLSHAKKAA
jgi:hypothetical protein